MDRVPTGIPGLDMMLHGGLIRGRPYTVSGPPGTGKTILCVQFLLEGIRRDEQVLLVTTDEPPNELRANLEPFGWNLSQIRILDATPDVRGVDKVPVRDVSIVRPVEYLGAVAPSIRRSSEFRPIEASIHALQETLKQELRERRYQRIVVDSVTALRYFYVREGEEDIAIQSFFRFLADLHITTLMTVETPEFPALEVSNAEQYMARGDIRLHRWMNGRGLRRGLTVEKLRASSHDQTLRPMQITNHGIVVFAEDRRRPRRPSPRPEAARQPAPAETAAEAPRLLFEPIFDSELREK